MRILPNAFGMDSKDEHLGVYTPVHEETFAPQQRQLDPEYIERIIANQLGHFAQFMEQRLSQTINEVNRRVDNFNSIPIKKKEVFLNDSCEDSEDDSKLIRSAKKVVISDDLERSTAKTPNFRKASRDKFNRRKEISSPSESSDSDSSSDYKGKSRRYSALKNIIAPKNLNATPVVSMQQEAYKGIRLEQLSVAQVMRFIDETNRYQAQWRVELRIATYVSDSVKRSLISKSGGLLTEGEFYQVTAKTLLKVIQKAVRPKSALAFSSAFNDNISFYISEKYNPHPTNLEIFYDALLLYRERVLLIFEFLSKKNSKNIPPCNNKEGGLIKIFIDKIPFEYGVQMLRNMRNTKFDTLEEFIDDFMIVAEKHCLQSRESRETMRFFKPAYRSYNNFPNRNFIKTNPAEALKDVLGVKPHGDKKINFIEDNRYDDNYYQNDVAQCESEQEACEHSDVEVEVNNEVNDVVNAIGTTNKNVNVEKSKLNACFNKLFRGVCGNAKCTFAHDRPTLEAAHAEFSELLRKSEFAKKTVHNMNNKSPELQNEELMNMIHDPRFLEDQLLYALPEAVVFPAVNIAGLVEFNQGDTTTLEASEILFDSGALHSSYISDEFLNENLEFLEEDIKPHFGRTLMANKSAVNIDKKVNLKIKFKDSKGDLHVLTSEFLVLPGLTYKVIVGLPDIVSKVGMLYRDMIDCAISESAGKVYNIENLIHPWSSGAPPIEEPPEEKEFPLPCAFTDALHYMEMSVEEAREEFKQQIDAHVSSEMRSSVPGIVKYLLQDAVDVFVPTSWTGINGINPIEFQWRDDLPERMKPAARPVNPKLFVHAKKEFDRLSGYFYEACSSPIASCLVIAPKATAPFIRFCGDYVNINKYIQAGHYPIPIIKHEINKIITFKVYIDIDWANSYHQFRLADLTSMRLSVQTPWGQVRPLFLPEGVTPASNILQEAMREIFVDFDEWTIRIFDNMLILAHDHQDAFEKLKKVINRCRERNIVLKFSKTWLGFPEVNFFGFICKHNSYGLSNQRKESINSFVMPDNVKKMQRFLGTANFFNSFIPKYSEMTAPLTDMTHDKFDWNPQTWTKDYVGAFERFKKACVEATEVFYPDYSLPWILRCDASDVAVSAHLVQVRTSVVGKSVDEPLGFASAKLSKHALNWPIGEKELYSAVFGVKKFDYELRCKPFVIETDHRNLQWMETSVVPKVMRWRIYLTSFNFLIKHIPGKLNVVADWQSRMYHVLDGVTEILTQVHGGRVGHHGERRTWQLLNEHFPGHSIPYRVVSEFVAECGTCQKVRLGMVAADTVKPLVRHLKPEEVRSVVGVDTLTITPPDSAGNEYVIVVVNHFTKFCALYPVKKKDGLSMANALIQFFTSYGKFDAVMSDPGSDLMSEVVQHLQKWLGIRAIVSLIDRHESNGVEGTNKIILRHLRALVCDERIADRWSEPSVLCWIQYVLNSFKSGESGITPYDAMFGSVDRKYFQLHEHSDINTGMNTYVEELDRNLTIVREASKKYQESLVTQRTKVNAEVAQNKFQAGDFVLKIVENLPNKLSTKYQGPFEVQYQDKNDVWCKHLVQGSVHAFHVTRLKLFYGSRDEAFKLAMTDYNQFVVKQILAFRGDPMTRTTMEFLVEFEDGAQVWRVWDKDITDTIAFETYCRTNAPLRLLLHQRSISDLMCKELRKSDITEVQPGDVVFVDLRCYGATWYSTLGLPDCDTKNYVLRYEYVDWYKGRRRIRVSCPVFQEVFIVDRVFVQMWGSIRELPVNSTLIDKSFLKLYPQLKDKTATVTPAAQTYILQRGERN